MSGKRCNLTFALNLFEESVMKTLRIIFGVGLTMIPLELTATLADMKYESSRVPLTFPLDIGDSSVIMADLTFDTLDGVGGEEAQATCAMTPGGAATGLLMQTPVIPLVNNRPANYTYNSPQVSQSPLDSLPPTTSYNPSSNRRRSIPHNTSIRSVPEKRETDTPEPATLLIVGLGISAAVVARRRWKNR
jgi:hypothetical protein